MRPELEAGCAVDSLGFLLEVVMTKIEMEYHTSEIVNWRENLECILKSDRFGSKASTARILGITQRTLNRWLNGESEPNWDRKVSIRNIALPIQENIKEDMRSAIVIFMDDLVKHEGNLHAFLEERGWRYMGETAMWEKDDREEGEYTIVIGADDIGKAMFEEAKLIF